MQDIRPNTPPATLLRGNRANTYLDARHRDWFLTVLMRPGGQILTRRFFPGGKPM